MLIRAEKSITKEQYKKAQFHGGYITDEELEDIFPQSMLCGYGIYDAIACARYNQETNETTYVVKYITSTNCD
jgi:hypothetical protein